MNEHVSLFNRVFVGCTVALFALAMFSGMWHQSVELSMGQGDSLAERYANVDALSGPSMGHGGGGG